MHKLTSSKHHKLIHGKPKNYHSLIVLLEVLDSAPAPILQLNLLFYEKEKRNDRNGNTRITKIACNSTAKKTKKRG